MRKQELNDLVVEVCTAIGVIVIILLVFIFVFFT